ncbi:Adenylate cyclase 1 [Pseudovibrio axinellae]|uniref:Adenylate cyclase 1 n=1 Tax=Pseudovibrio axinellae TaxID=989403 RepID=A0A161V7W8_9HYPH|nr:adenylate/guanylate cyclase domain-containing protein [Pseudovibrio axinellae]KZL21004.1 Adenylate cyclase 1 [Pseudovibrio axinellae]SEP79368.1 adenylate cyclase [Pseudovibrio axinellae]
MKLWFRIKRSIVSLLRCYYKLSLTWLVAITFVTVVTLCGGIVLYMSVLTNLKTTRSLVEKASIMSTKAINNALGAYFNPAFSSVYAIKTYAEEQPSAKNAIFRAKQTFRGVLFGVKSIDGLVLSLPDGTLWGLKHDADKKELVSFKPEQPLFQFTNLQVRYTKSQTDPFWGEFFAGSEDPFSTISSAIKFEGETIAYVSAIITMKGVGAILSSSNADNLGPPGVDEDVTRFILTSQNNVLAYASPINELQQHNLLSHVSTFGDPVLAKLEESKPQPFSQRARKQGVELRLINDGEDIYVLVLQRLTSEDGRVYYVGEYQLANSRYDEFSRLSNSIFAGIAVVFLSALVAIFFARRLSSPLKAIARRAEKFGALEFDHLEPLPRSHIREVDQITTAMNTSINGLRAMSRYIPKSLYSKLMVLGIDQAAKAKEAELTILFTDIEGFTSISEHRSAGEVANLLNEHFKLLVSAVEAHKGTVDKFIGDGMLAFWGAPNEMEDHAERAIAAAEDIVKAVHEANKAEPENALHVRIAIHTGPVIVGNVGAVERWNYTIVGDAVNVCNRLQVLGSSMTSLKGACVLVSGETVEKAHHPDSLTCRGRYEIRGRKGKVEVWQLNSTMCDEE